MTKQPPICALTAPVLAGAGSPERHLEMAGSLPNHKGMVVTVSGANGRIRARIVMTQIGALLAHRAPQQSRKLRHFGPGR